VSKESKDSRLIFPLGGIFRVAQAVDRHAERGAVADGEHAHGGEPEPDQVRQLLPQGRELLPPEWGGLGAAAHQAAAAALALAALAVVAAPAARQAVHGQHRPAVAAAGGGARGRVAGAAVQGVPQVRLHRAPAAC